jgi:CPA2 family monovalent cation:H+ antiporter-2
VTPAETLPQLVLTLGVAVVAALFVGFFRLPAVAGFMLAGAVIGPSGFALVKDMHAVELLAEIGVILLLFTIGLEFSLERLRRIARLVAVGGTLQVGLTTIIAVVVSVSLGFTVARGVFFGFLVALSSTAIVLRGLAERGETDAPHGRFTIGALIYQDLCVIPMMLMIPILARIDAGGDIDAVATTFDILFALGKAAVFVIVALVAGRYVVPVLLRLIDHAKSREVFLIAVLVMCAGVAVLTAMVGLSLALGAFLAGVLLADGAWGQRAMSNVIPLRDILTTMFFLSLGMLFDAGVVSEHPFQVGALFCAMFLGKGLVATLACLAMRFPARVAWLAGVGLAQFGEFGFVLAREGQKVGLLGSEGPAILSAGLLTMFVTPVAMRLGPHVSAGAKLLRPLERIMGARGVDEAKTSHSVALKGHVIIGGYGVGGRLLSEAMRELGTPYIVLDVDGETVRRAPKGEPVFLGDVASGEALEHARVHVAAAVVLLLADMNATRSAIAEVRAQSKSVPIIVRARRLNEHAELLRLGATDVVSEELEGGIETLARVLRTQGTPANQLSRLIRQAREGFGDSARRIAMPRNKKRELLALDELKVESVHVPVGSPAVGAACPAVEGVVCVAVKRGTVLHEAPHTLALAVDDVVYLVGDRNGVYRVAAAIDPGVGDPRLRALPPAPPSATAQAPQA